MMIQSDKDVVEILKNQGWECRRDEVGDRYCLLDLGDRQLCVIPTLQRAPDYKNLAFMETVSTKEFTDADNYIFDGDRSDHSSFVKPWNSDFTKRAAEITERDIEALAKDIINWAKNQDIEKALEKYRNERPDRPGQKQLYHLVALALAGEVETLEGYQNNFLKGETLNFVPMITIDVINRAVELARKNAPE